MVKPKPITAAKLVADEKETEASWEAERLERLDRMEREQMRCEREWTGMMIMISALAVLVVFCAGVLLVREISMPGPTRWMETLAILVPTAIYLALGAMPVLMFPVMNLIVMRITLLVGLVVGLYFMFTVFNT